MPDSGDNLSRTAFVVTRRPVQGLCAMDEQAHISYHQDDIFGAVTAPGFRFEDAPASDAAMAA